MAVKVRPKLVRASLALTVVAAVLAGGPATDAQPAPTMTASPTTVRDGGSIAVQATGCLDEQGSSEGLHAVALAARLSYPNSGNLEGLSAFRTEPAADGTWSGTIYADTREDYFGPYDDYETTLRGVCMRGDTVLFEYDGIAISYDGRRNDEPETTTSTAVAPTEPTTTATSPAPAPAPPAGPITTAATYTG
jgi:hypothetical protein